MRYKIIFSLLCVGFLSAASPEKVQRLADVMHLPESELTLVVDFIEENWDQWMESSDIEFELITLTDHSYLTVHPGAHDVCLFLEGHTQFLGAGAFKRAEKGVSYHREEEIALAIPHEIAFNYSLFSGSASESSWDSSTWSPLDSETWSTWDTSTCRTSCACSSYLNSYIDLFSFGELAGEAKALERIQGSRRVLELYFISFHEIDGEKLPIIVSKFYNGGAFYELEDPTLDTQLLIFNDILLALTDIHQRGISHGDLHKGNVLVEKDPISGEVQGAIVADFGLSQGDCFGKCLEQDLNSLRNMFHDVPELQGILAESKQNKWSVNTLYEHFNDLLPNLVDPKIEKQIFAHAYRQKRLKLRLNDTILWVSSSR